MFLTAWIQMVIYSPFHGFCCTSLSMLYMKGVSFMFYLEKRFFVNKYDTKDKNKLWILLAHHMHFLKNIKFRMLSWAKLYILPKF